MLVYIVHTFQGQQKLQKFGRDKSIQKIAFPYIYSLKEIPKQYKITKKSWGCIPIVQKGSTAPTYWCFSNTDQTTYIDM